MASKAKSPPRVILSKPNVFGSTTANTLRSRSPPLNADSASTSVRPFRARPPVVPL